jgi:hypothetical protein
MKPETPKENQQTFLIKEEEKKDIATTETLASES